MEAQQCVKLSLTNRSIGLIPPRPPKDREYTNTVASRFYSCAFCQWQKGSTKRQTLCNAKRRKRPGAKPTLDCQDPAPTPGPFVALQAKRLSVPSPFGSAKRLMCLDDLVAMARGQTPDPIPNSAVKTLSADGTASQDAGE